MIRVKNLTKDYGHRKGIFDLSFEVQNGEAFGFLGPHGAGKTTTIRQLQGFAYPTRGRCFINGKSCHVKQDEIQRFTGYLPENSQLPNCMSGLGFLRFAAQMKGIRNMEHAFSLAERFECEIDIKIHNMSKETKRKISIIGALLHDPRVLLLDEPFNHLGPEMQSRFADLLMEEKRRGKTIFISSHLLDEAEQVCDRIGMVYNGILINIDSIERIRTYMEKSYVITFETEQDAQRFSKENFKIKEMSGCRVMVNLTGKISPLVEVLSNYPVAGLETQKGKLEDLFSHFFGGGRRD